MQKHQSRALKFKKIALSCCLQHNGRKVINASGLLIKEHIGFSVLDTGLRHLGHTLVIELVPQLVHVVPAVRDVVATWGETHRV